MIIKQIILASRPHGLPTSANFLFEDKELGKLNEGEVLLKPWFFSVDPYMRGRMNNVKSYANPFEENKPIPGRSVARVMESKSKIFAEGDLAVGTLPWATYAIEKAEKLQKIDSQLAPPSYQLGILGVPGLTAYFGMVEICKPKIGETVVVSGAAGAVGLVAGQIAKIRGSRVVGISGSNEKCRMLKEQFGFDEAINYKSIRMKDKDIATLCPQGIDVYYDNVGGEITDAVIANLNFHSRMAVCGQISQYNNIEVPIGPNFLPLVLTRSILIQGFIVGNYSSRFGEGFTHLIQWVKEGKLTYKETIIHGFDRLPEAFLGLFNGDNVGKMLVEIE